MAAVIPPFNRFQTWLRDPAGVAIRAPQDCARNQALLNSYRVIFYKFANRGDIVLPPDFNKAANTIECIGESGTATQGSTLAAGGGGGAGAYSSISNYALAGPYERININMGNGGSFFPTVWDTTNTACSADFGLNATGATGGLGGQAIHCTGTTKFDGGSGGNAGTNAGGSGGGAAGPYGAGSTPANSGATASSQGGAADNGRQVGGAGVGTTNPGNPGIAEVVWTQTSNGEAAGPSSGASGAGGLTTTAEAGGSAVAYGGAPGGGDLVLAGNSSAGTPAPGLIVLTYLSAPPPPFGGICI